MEEVARRADVSRALVSIVFRELPGASAETRDRVRAAAAEIGYRPDHRARLLSRRETRLLGTVFHIGDEFQSDLLVELYAAAAAEGYELVLSGVTARRTEADAVHELQSLRCDALILLGPTMRASDLRTIGRLTPTVAVARAVAADVDVVRTDDVTGARIATKHLLDLGHSRIVHVDGGRSPGAAERRRGYQHAMRAAGLAGLISLQTGGLTEADGRAAALRLLAVGAPLPTAAFVFNDQSALGHVDAFRRAGVDVPADHSVIGFDNSRIARSVWTQLSTVGQDAPSLGRSAVDRAVGRLRQQSTPRRTTLVPPELVVRQSTRPLPDNR